MPGILNTVSTITTPVTRMANVGPSVVTTGIREFLSTCLITTRRSERPFAQAVRNVVLADRVQRAGTRQPSRIRDRQERESDHRHDQVVVHAEIGRRQEESMLRPSGHL